MSILIKMIVSKDGTYTMAKYYSIEPKEVATFRLDKNLNKDLTNYAIVKGLNKSETINKILFDFFKDTILTNSYLTSKAGLYFKIPLDFEFKRSCIKNKIILNKDNDSTTIGENTITIKIKQIPNNLDIFISSDGINKAGSFQTNKYNVLHSGIDFIFIFDSIKPNKPSPLLFDIDVLDYLYCFYFEVTSDNKTNVYLINPYEASNKLSDVNNRIVGDKLIDMVEHLNEIEQQVKYNYKRRMEKLQANNEQDNKKLFYWDKSFKELLFLLNEFRKNNSNENIKLIPIKKNTNNKENI